MTQRPWNVIIAYFPLALGIIMAALVALGWIDRYVFYLRADIGMLALLVGLLFSAALLAIISSSERTHKKNRRQIEAIHANAVQERRRFLQRLDHELKNPLTAIRAGLANLTEPLPDEMRRNTLKSIETQTLRLSRLAADLRKLAELETRPLERAPVGVGELLHEVVEVAQERPEAAERRLTLSVPQAPWPLPPVDGDYDLLFLAVHNLVDNALKFTQTGDTVEVRAFEADSEVVIEVADTGSGVPNDEVEHIWEELYRGNQARGIPGSGLGLALVRAIAERHGGAVNLRSRSGQGSVFTFRLPTHS
ncbi:MAG: HAMP domain-containing histidine kinase [Anaerolineales bacterium]|nr:HAMP domain-containing histidine kinase [Anaerolineales bacterium]